MNVLESEVQSTPTRIVPSKPLEGSILEGKMHQQTFFPMAHWVHPMPKLTGKGDQNIDNFSFSLVANRSIFWVENSWKILLTISCFKLHSVIRTPIRPRGWSFTNFLECEQLELVYLSNYSTEVSPKLDSTAGRTLYDTTVELSHLNRFLLFINIFSKWIGAHWTVLISNQFCVAIPLLGTTGAWNLIIVQMGSPSLWWSIRPSGHTVWLLLLFRYLPANFWIEDAILPGLYLKPICRYSSPTGHKIY